MRIIGTRRDLTHGCVPRYPYAGCANLLQIKVQGAGLARVPSAHST